MRTAMPPLATSPTRRRPDQVSDLCNPAYQAFRAEVPKTQAAASAHGSPGPNDEQGKGRRFARWQTTMLTVSATSHFRSRRRSGSRQRRRATTKSKPPCTSAAEKFRPFLSDLSDVEKALSHDVTVRGVKNMEERCPKRQLEP